MKCSRNISTFETDIASIWNLGTFIDFSAEMSRLSIFTSEALVARRASAKIFKLTFKSTVIIDTDFAVKTRITLTFVDIATFIGFCRRFFTNVVTGETRGAGNVEARIDFYTVVAPYPIHAIFGAKTPVTSYSRVFRVFYFIFYWSETISPETLSCQTFVDICARVITVKIFALKSIWTEIL